MIGHNEFAQSIVDSLKRYLLTIFSVAVAFLLFVFLFKRIDTEEEIANIIITAVLGLATTFVGLYFSFNLTLRQEKESALAISEKKYIASLKLIFVELDLNERAVQYLLSGLEMMPIQISQMAEGYAFLLKISKRTKTNNFYALISTDSIVEISKDNIIFNAVLHAYYNLELILSDLEIAQDTCQAYISLTDVPSEFVNSANSSHVGLTKKMKRLLTMIRDAKSKITTELDKNGIKFSDTTLENAV